MIAEGKTSGPKIEDLTDEKTAEERKLIAKKKAVAVKKAAAIKTKKEEDA
jgi:hypothetical protein